MKTKKETTMAKKNKAQAVIICTAKRAVVFGYIDEAPEVIIERGTVKLTKARMCHYWSAETKGVTGLASIGPQSGSKIALPVEELSLESVTAVMKCSPAAIDNWESASWGK